LNKYSGFAAQKAILLTCTVGSQVRPSYNWRSFEHSGYSLCRKNGVAHEFLPFPVSEPSSSLKIPLNGVYHLILFLTSVNSKPDILIVLAPLSVAAAWKQWEHVPKAAALFQSKLKNLTPLITKFSVLGVMIPWGCIHALSSFSSVF